MGSKSTQGPPPIEGEKENNTLEELQICSIVEFMRVCNAGRMEGTGPGSCKHTEALCTIVNSIRDELHNDDLVEGWRPH